MPAKLKAEHHVVRYVSWTRLRKDEDDNVLGVLAAAFTLRRGEKYLSATWAEFFQGPRRVQIEGAVRAIRASSIQVSPRSGFAVGNIGRVGEACQSCGHRIRFLHEPEADNAAHSALRRWPRDADDLFELLAEDAWSETVLNKDVP